VRFHHIGLFVPDLAGGRQSLSALLPVRDWEAEIDDPGLRVRVQFGLDAAGVRYELVAPLGEKNPVEGALRTGRNILNHVAYCVDDIAAERGRLEAEGCFSMTEPHPAVAFGGRPVMFLMTPLRFILELIEEPAPAE